MARKSRRLQPTNALRLPSIHSARAALRACLAAQCGWGHARKSPAHLTPMRRYFSRHALRKVMQPAFQSPLGSLAFAAVLAANPAITADLDVLPALNAAITESSISGLSSGAFMAVQFGTAWS